MNERLSLAPYLADVDRLDPLRWTGQVTEVTGLLVESRGPSVAIGDFCEIQDVRRAPHPHPSHRFS